MKQFKIYEGSNLDILPTLPDNSVDSIVTDPPYELGFMGKSWDSTGIAYNTEMWKQCFRVLKHGGHLVAFSGSRTYHRMAVAIEDAGFQIRDQMMWVYGSGFPKSHNISKSIDRSAGAERKVIGSRPLTGNGKTMKSGFHQPDGTGAGDTIKKDVFEFTAPATDEAKQWEGWGTALKPAHEPIVLARKPLEDGLTVAENILKWGVGGLNIDGCRVSNNGEQFGNLPNWGGGKQINKDGLSFAEQGHDHKDDGNAEAVAKLKQLGRFPANLMHDGSQEVLDLFPKEAGAFAPVKSGFSGKSKNGIYNDYETRGDDGATFYSDKGSASRFFYCPKANKKDRDEGCEEFETKEKPAHMRTAGGTGETSMTDGFQATQRKNTHPTVKPTELMRYLCRLVTPPNGTVLDPFNGSGSTGKGAIIEGFNYIGIELDQEYIKISEARINAYINKP